MQQAEKKFVPSQQEPEQKKGKKKEKEKKTLKQEIMSWIWTILAALAIALLIRAFIAEPIRVDGTSMTNTLQDGEIVLVSKLDYLFGEKQRNDIVICRYPGRMNGSVNIGAAVSLDSYTLFVKRLVALPGDTVEIKDGHLYVNDEMVPDPEYQGSVPRNFEKITLGGILRHGRQPPHVPRQPFRRRGPHFRLRHHGQGQVRDPALLQDPGGSVT